jgi:hypothetical protein
MSNAILDLYEAPAYGRFTAAQILTLLLGLDPELDPTIRLVAARSSTASDVLEVALLRTNAPPLLLHRPEAGAPDPVPRAREVLRALVHHAERSHDGFAVASRLLQGESLSTAIRRTPQRLLARMEHAGAVLQRRKVVLPEHDEWTARVIAARDNLASFDEKVRALRTERRSITSDITYGWIAWQRTYAATKHFVQGVLVSCDKVGLERELFDDLQNEEEERLSELPVTTI